MCHAAFDPTVDEVREGRNSNSDDAMEFFTETGEGTHSFVAKLRSRQEGDLAAHAIHHFSTRHRYPEPTFPRPPPANRWSAMTARQIGGMICMCGGQAMRGLRARRRSE